VGDTGNQTDPCDSQLHSYPVSIPVQAGDVLAVYVVQNWEGILTSSNSGQRWATAAISEPAVGDTITAGPVRFQTNDIDVSATLENDNDLGISTPANLTVDASGPSGAAVSYTLPTASDPDDATAPTVACSPAPGATFPIGATTVTCTATDPDDANSPVTTSFTVTVNDKDLALSGMPANITANATSPAGATVTYALPTAVDEEPGASVSCDHAPGSTFPIGTTTVTCTATDPDDANSPVSQTFTVTVNYSFTGFAAPVDNPPAVNMVTAGQSIPIQFSLGGNFGLGIIAAGYPTVQQVSCTSGAPVNTGTETDTAGASGLQYDATTGTYTYVWKTAKAAKGTCQVFTLGLTDGTVHTANFQYAN
jgi:hypothetical protein